MTFEIRKIGVIGAGQMGSGIAQVSAAAGFDVVLNDISEDRIAAAIARIDGNLGRLVEREAMSPSAKAAAMARIKPGATFKALSTCDLVIEAATENEEVKRQIFADFCAPLKKDAIIATNTSSISITRLASTTDRPDPLHRHSFHESGAAHAAGRADPRHRDRGRDLRRPRAPISRSSTRRSTVSEDFPAFIVNRILLPMINEAIYTLYEGVGTVDAIDTAMRLGANHPMGPLQLADFIGLDTCLSVMQVLHEGLADSKYRPCPLLVKYVEAGWLGRKTQRGFYDYRSGAPIPTR